MFSRLQTFENIGYKEKGFCLEYNEEKAQVYRTVHIQLVSARNSPILYLLPFHYDDSFFRLRLV